jgi:hypothetical protein
MMLIQIEKRVIVCCAVFVFCLMSAPIKAEHGRNFAGDFQVRNVIDEGATIKFELHVKVFNFSGADVKDATLALADPRAAGRDPDASDYQGSITNVSIGYRKSIELDGSFIVPLREYREWQRGAAPHLVVAYADEAGKELRSAVELKPAVGGGLPKGDLQ